MTSPSSRRGRPGRKPAERSRFAFAGWRLAVAGAGVLALGIVLGATVTSWLAEDDEREAAAAGAPSGPAVVEDRSESGLVAHLPAPEVPVPTEARPAPAPAPAEARLAPAAQVPSEARPAPAAPAPAWRRFAAAAPEAAGRPLIAVVIDDLGHSPGPMQRTIGLRAPLTLAFLPYGRDLPAHAAAARRAGHEVLVHLPMEPVDSAQDPGPNALRSALGAQELSRLLAWQLSRFDGYAGVNNHMGSRFSADRAGMAVVMAEVKVRGLLYLDSRTTPDTVAPVLARRLGVPAAHRDVFLDNDQNTESVRERLSALEDVARRQGYAVAIGHPHPGTLDVIEDWLIDLEARGFALAPVSAIVEERLAAAARAEGSLSLRDRDGGVRGPR